MSQETLSAVTWDIYRTPCFQRAVAAGGLMGAGWGAITYASSKNVLRASNFAVASFMGVASFTYFTCRQVKKAQRQQVVEQMNAQIGKQQEEKLKVLRELKREKEEREKQQD